jgi:hypothetical protein
MYALPAIMAFSAVYQGINSNTVAHLETLHPFAHFHNCGGKFMAKDNRTSGAPCQRMGLRRNNKGSAPEFMEIGPAYTTLFNFDLYLARCDLWVRIVFESNIFFGIPDCCLHFILLPKNSVP